MKYTKKFFIDFSFLEAYLTTFMRAFFLGIIPKTREIAQHKVPIHNFNNLKFKRLSLIISKTLHDSIEIRKEANYILNYNSRNEKTVIITMCIF